MTEPSRHRLDLLRPLDDVAESLDGILDRTDNRRLPLHRSLQIASDLAHALGEMHQQGLIHRDIKPANILVGDAGDVRLTGFAIASRLRRERQALAPPEVIAGTFAYMAPEQSGRMNRSVDARSDLYSFGVTLYELLTGALPFDATEPMEWIHCHIAHQPPAPSDGLPELPAMLDDIVLKLLAKDPEARYQTAAGVELDLRRCLTQLRTNGHISAFALAAHDVPDQLMMPEKLYGREVEIGMLRAAFERVAERGTPELVLISGYAGIGKTSIVNELHKVMVQPRGLFAAGKFDQYKRDIPYATLAQAFQGLVHQLLNKSDEDLAHWRHELSAALGPNGQLMVNLIPKLALIMGEQPAIPEVDPQDAGARFHWVFRNFVGVFARREHPLVLFIDDLQWLDAGTLALLQSLITNLDSCHLLVVGAYRDNEVDATHPLFSTLAAIRGAGGEVSELTLLPLSVEEITWLCADALHMPPASARALAHLVSEKTGGNPFFTIQFITSMAEEGLLNFDVGRATWQYDIERIRAKRITDNVADLMATKLGRLPATTQAVLAQLACMGNVAEIALLATLRGVSESQLEATLRDAMEAGLIVFTHPSVAFTHDRVHEAAYALVPPEGRAAAHRRIGMELLSQTAAADLDERIFEIISQFDRGASKDETASQRELIAGLYLRAGKRAKASSAYAAAQTYFAAGRALLGADSWTHCYRLTLDLELQRAECEIVGNELDVAQQRLAMLNEHAIGVTDQAAVVCLDVLLYFTTGRSERAVEVALRFLASVGIEWGSRPTEADVRQEYLAIRRRLQRQPIDTLIDLHEMSDETCIATMAVLTELFPAAYAVDRYLLDLVLLRMTNLSLEHGHCESSSVAYSALNMTLGFQFADYTTAYAFGRLACELVERRGINRFKARVYSCFAAFTMPWFRHIPLCQPLMTQAFDIGSSKGDMAFAAYNSRNRMTHLLMSGMPLEQVQQQAEQAMTFARKIQLGLPAERFIGQLELIRRLRGSFERLPDDDDWTLGEVEQHPQLAMMVCYHWLFRLQEHYLAADFPSALAAAQRIAPIRWAMRSSIEEAEYDFYSALAYAAACDGASTHQCARYSQALAQHLERIVLWAENCPENFANREALIGAEIARLDGQDLQAQALYERAVQLSAQHGFVQNEALASELAGQFYSARNLTTIANAYLRNARDCYERWGAMGKVHQLDLRYPQLRARDIPAVPSATVDRSIAQLDVETVDKASQTLSSEMVLSSLLEKLMRLAVEHAGAQRGLLVLLHGDEPLIEAQATTAHGGVDVTLRTMRVTPANLPLSALQYVLRTHERLVLDDASAGGLDPHDEYVLRHRPRSVLCLPIFKQTEVIGALYLENNLASCAFTSGRVAVLDFLASQAAIWLENARLYSDLRRSETWLKEAQHLSATGSFYWLVDADIIEFSEQMYRIYELDPAAPVTLATIASRIHPEDHPLLQEMVDIARGPATDLDYLYRAQMPDGAVKHLHIVAHGAPNRDGRTEYIGSIQDVTQRRLSEETLGKVRSELAHVARVTSLGVLTASIAHEVNQPLAGIVTNASTCLRMLGSEPPNLDGARETARRMIRDGHRAADVITRLRALFARNESASEVVDLNEATREVIGLSANELRKFGVQLRSELAPNLPRILGDRVQLQQVVLNLLLNAAEAMSAVADRARHVLIRTELDDDNGVCLSVRDAGVGIDAQAVAQIFEAFYSTKQGGMGIGLSVSRSIIESHKGRLWARENDGPGATFAFRLPGVSEESTALRPIAAAEIAPQFAD